MSTRICAGIAAAFVCVLAAGPAAACINTFESEIRRYQAQGDEAGVAGEIAKLEADYRKDRSLEHTNDLAVGRLLTRRYAESIELLLEAEQRFPGKAIVAANLGTAYELSGKDAEALRWIREGVRRDPKEHLGTEWLHVKILEAKLEMARDPEWLKRNTVLGMNFGDADVPVMPASLPADDAGRLRAPKELHDAIWYQLEERTKFVGPPDSVVADLYAAKGDLAFATWKPGLKDPLDYPSYSYADSLMYGTQRQSLVQRRKQTLESLGSDVWYGHDSHQPTETKPVALKASVTKDSSRQTSSNRTWIALLFVGAAAAAWYFLRVRRLRKP